MMRSVTAREANQAFSRILKAAESGETVVITGRGEPVAIIAPYRTRDREREQAIERVVALMRKGLPIGGGRNRVLGRYAVGHCPARRCACSLQRRLSGRTDDRGRPYP
jgi:prevent-host-death family protein